MTWTAPPITSAGRFSPLGPLGMGLISHTVNRRATFGYVLAIIIAAELAMLAALGVMVLMVSFMDTLGR
jgi:hypothetical protein